MSGSTPRDHEHVAETRGNSISDALDRIVRHQQGTTDNGTETPWHQQAGSFCYLSVNATMTGFRTSYTQIPFARESEERNSSERQQCHRWLLAIIDCQNDEAAKLILACDRCHRPAARRSLFR